MLRTGHAFRMLSRGILCVILLPVSASSATEVPSTDELFKIEKQAIESRRNIKSGRVVAVVRFNAFAQDPSYLKIRKQYTYSFQANNERSEESVSSPTLDYSTEAILTPDTYIIAGSSAKNVQLFGPNTKPKDSPLIPAMRELGLVAWSVDSIGLFGMENHLLRTDRDDLRITSDTYHGIEIWKVSYHVENTDGGFFGEHWIAPSMGHLPIYISVWEGEGKDRNVLSVHITLKQYKNDDIWFPKEVVFRSTHGDKLLVEEVTTVEEAEFGQDFDDQTFTLAGLKLDKGRVVDSDGKLMWWTGDSLTPVILGQEYQGDVFVEEGQSRLWLLAVNGIVLAVLAAVILYRRRVHVLKDGRY